MRVYLVHHAPNLSPEEDPGRHLSEEGRAVADRLGTRLKDAGAAPVRILHSDKQWTRETAERIAAVLGMEDRTIEAEYPIATGDPVAPFLAEIKACDGDIMMAGHFDYLLRTASNLVCGDEANKVIEFKPGTGTAFCLEGSGDDWTVIYGWRPEHAPL